MKSTVKLPFEPSDFSRVSLKNLAISASVSAGMMWFAWQS
jgi:hypothetical protein